MVHPMFSLSELLERNKKWASKIQKEDPNFFPTLAKQQNPQFLWIGCSDSRVSANQIVDVLPGEIFVHRNVANLVIHTDFNCLSVIQYAIDVLKVKHIIVCGHYDCGGIKAAMEDSAHGLIDNWLQTIKKIERKHREKLDVLTTHAEREDLLTEINIVEQVINLGRTTIVENAWARDQELILHGWVYSLRDGILKSLDVDAKSESDIERIRNEIG